MKINETLPVRKLSRGVAFVAMSAALWLAMGGEAAAAIQAEPQSFSRAACLFAIVWIIASLRIGRQDGRFRIAFEWSPIKRLAEPAKAVLTAKETLS